MAKFKAAVASVLALVCCTAFADTVRWPEKKAADWYAAQRWLVGSDYIPADAINQLEMWQAATFNPAQIDKELGWAQAIGMNTMRVFLHDQLWKQDAEGFRKRLPARARPPLQPQQAAAGVLLFLLVAGS